MFGCRNIISTEGGRGAHKKELLTPTSHRNTQAYTSDTKVVLSETLNFDQENS
ncbi:MAG: hypothetical protein AAF228_13740 [Pseudomonadota bacterium]